MFFKRQRKKGQEQEIAESIKKDLISTLQKKGIQVTDVYVDISQEVFSIHLKGFTENLIARQ